MSFGSPSSSTTISALLRLILILLLAAIACFPFVAAEITVDDLYKTTVALLEARPGFNTEGFSVFTNVVNAYNEGQFFFINTGSFVYENQEEYNIHR